MRRSQRERFGQGFEAALRQFWDGAAQCRNCDKSATRKSAITLPQTFFCLAGALRSRPVKSEVQMMRRRMAPSQRSYRLMSACAQLVAALGLFSAPVVAAAQARETIIVQGNRRIDAETVRSYFHAAPNGRIDAAARDAALKALLATGLFDNVAIDQAGERLIVHLTEAP